MGCVLLFRLSRVAMGTCGPDVSRSGWRFSLFPQRARLDHILFSISGDELCIAVFDVNSTFFCWNICDPEAQRRLSTWLPFFQLEVGSRRPKAIGADRLLARSGGSPNYCVYRRPVFGERVERGWCRLVARLMAAFDPLRSLGQSSVGSAWLSLNVWSISASRRSSETWTIIVRVSSTEG